MRRLRSVKAQAHRIELPKGAIVALCASILTLPAGLAIAHNPKLDSGGGWQHAHTTSYTSCNYVDQNADLKTQVGNARTNWFASTYAPTLISMPHQNDCHPGSGAQTYIQHQDAYYGNTGWRASSTDEQGANAYQHFRHAHINYNLSASWSGYTGYDRRALVCKEIGQVIGVERVFSAEWAAHGTSNDCMSFGGNPSTQVSKVENSTNYTYTDWPGPHSRDLLDAKYHDHDDIRPSIQVQGPLVASPNPLVPLDFTVDVSATDNLTGVVAVSLEVDGQLADELTQDCPIGSGDCSISGALSPLLVELGSGQHTYRISARDGNGNTSVPVEGAFTLDANPPELSLSGPVAAEEGRPLESGDLQVLATDAGSVVSGVRATTIQVGDTTVVDNDSGCSQACPTTSGAQYQYERSTWGTGPHVITITATDRAGNVAEDFVLVDPPPAPEINCPAVSPTTSASGEVLTPAEAENAALPDFVEPTQAAYIQEIDESLDPSLVPVENEPADPLQAVGSLNVSSDTVATDPEGEIVVGAEVCMVPLQTTTAASNATVVNGDSALYANSAPDTDTIVRPTAAGETIVHSIRGPEAPNEFKWKIGLVPGLELRSLPDGRLAVVTGEPPEEDSGVSVPPEPAQAAAPEEVADVATQYEDAYYESALAEQASNAEVVAVLAEPHVITSSGHAEPTSSTLSESGVLTVDSDPTARAVTMRWLSRPGKCFKANGIITRPQPGVETQWYGTANTCIGKTKTGIRGRFVAKPPPGAHGHISVQLRVVASRDGKVVTRSKTHINPDWDGWLNIRTPGRWTKGRWCGRLKERTRNNNWEIGWLQVPEHIACARLAWWSGVP